MIKVQNNKIYEFIFYLFGISLFILKIPPLTTFEGISKLSSSHVFAKVALLVIAIILIWLNRKSELYSLLTKDFSYLIISLYFISASISVVAAENISFFLQQYQNVVLGIVIFYISYTLVQKVPKKQLITGLIFVGLIFVVFDIVFALFPSQILMFLRYFLQEEMYSLYKFNQGEYKYNLYLTSEAFLPFLILYFRGEREIKYGGIFSMIIVSLIGYLAIFSNFRTRLIQFIFSFTLSMHILNKVSKKKFISFTILTVTSIIISFVMIRNSTSYDIVDRFAMSNSIDSQTIQYRLDTFSNAIEMIKISPFIGVGLGNYKTYINQSKTSQMADRDLKLHAEETNDNPHSVFVQIATETGLIGICVYLILLFYFIRVDMVIFLDKIFEIDPFVMLCIIASWTIFLYGIFNPFNTIFLNGWFWCFRGMIEGLKYEYKK